MMKKQHLQLSQQHLSSLTTLLAKGSLNARVARRASALLQLQQGATLQLVAKSVGVVYQTVAEWRDKYLAHGLDFLADKARTGRPVVFDGVVRARITALACSETDTGHGIWSLRLLAEKAVELNYCERISYSKVGDILKKTHSSRI
ncbi:MAG: hypothetical protein NVSMB56_20350 [Pyrinomonadaceae bacterium]